MATKYINARQKQRIATANAWQSANPVLLSGELAVESDTNKIKVGNGNTGYNSLPYIGGGSDFIQKEVTLAASGWSNRQYVLNDNDIKAASIILFDAPVGADINEYNVLQNAVIVAASQTNGQLVLQSLGVVPTVDVTASLAIL